jgi:N6-adenosine-specific RNA methylase IME4
MTQKDFFCGMGYTTRKNCEMALLAKKGNPKRLRKDIPELIIAPRREHSRKPVEGRQRIEAYCEGPRLEMFSREAAPGWVAWGNQTDKFPGPVAIA